MDWPTSGCRHSGRRDLGISGFAHQQHTAAAVGPGYGWRPAVAAVPRQRGAEHSSAVQRGFGPLPGRDCLCRGVSGVAEAARGPKSQSGTGGQEDFAASCWIALHHGSSSGSSCSAGCLPNSDGCGRATGGRFSSSGTSTAAGETDATPGRGPDKAREAEASQGGLLQHRRRTDQSHRGRLNPTGARPSINKASLVGGC